MREARQRRIVRTVEGWFARHQRPLPWRARYDPYEVWVSEVMAQQTRLEVVVRYFERFVARFPDPASLASASEDDVATIWSGLGYYRRARMLRQGAADVVARFRGTVPKELGDLLTIAGIGRYTAGAIRAIAFDLPAPAVDGNVTRILARLEGEENPWELAAALVERASSPRAFNQGLMELGALICKPRNPDCAHCPLRRDCVAFASGRIHELPSRVERPAQRRVRVELFVVRDDRGRVLLLRERGPLMKSLYHLPHGDTSLLEAETIDVVRGERLGTVRHTITTRSIEFNVFAAELAERAARGSPGVLSPTNLRIADAEPPWQWVHPDDLASVPHPSYVAKALRLLRNRHHG